MCFVFYFFIGEWGQYVSNPMGNDLNVEQEKGF